MAVATLVCLWLFIAGFVAWLVASVLAAESARYAEPDEQWHAEQDALWRAHRRVVSEQERGRG